MSRDLLPPKRGRWAHWVSTFTKSGYQTHINHLIHEQFTQPIDPNQPKPAILPSITRFIEQLLTQEGQHHPTVMERFQQTFIPSAITPADKLRCLSLALLFCKQLEGALAVSSLYQIAHYQWSSLDPTFDILFPKPLSEAITALQQISDTIDRALESTAPLAKTETLWEVSEQIVHLTRAQYALRDLGDGFGPLLALVIAHFADVIKAEGEKIREDQQRAPVPNPYVIANPVQGALFVGREDVLRRIEELWGSTGQCPSVLLYGHRRMGKSSVLQNLSRLRLPEKSVLVDFNLQRIGRVRSTAELLHGLSLKLYDAARKAGLLGAVLSEPLESDFLDGGKNPYLALDRFLDRLGSLRDGHRFLVTIDEFELLEEQIDAGRVDPQLLSVFRGVVQTYPWLVIALAGLHRLEELRHDYWNPLFGSVSAIEVSFLGESAARTLITAPTPDFPLDYDAAAIARIYELTHGQPYLIQLICHSLVSRYNRMLSEEPVPPLRRFQLTDVESVVAEADLFTDGLRYFQGVWDHAVRSKPHGQAGVLSVLATHPSGLLLDELGPLCGLPLPELQAALRALIRHAVLRADSGRYRFTVELLRRWILGQSGQLQSRHPATDELGRT